MDALGTAPSRIISKMGRALAVAPLLLAACGGGREPASSPPPSSGPESPASAGHDARTTILFLGTSLTAGFGLDPDRAYPALIQARIDSLGLSYRVVNAGVSGETSAGALRRVDWLLRQPVAVLVVETGANDGLRGQDPEATRANIQAILDRARRESPPPRLVLAGMEALPNYGLDYRRRFRVIFPELARENGAALVPFLLEGVAGRPELNQPDGIHPSAAGHEVLADNVWRVLRPLL
jgi:acyl-CoA thioesterase-1